MLARETVLSGNGALSSLVLRLLHLVLSYNHNTPDVMTGIRCVSREVALKKILSYRAMGLLCRQQAVLRPETSWKWLSEAERWEHLAHVEIASHFRECNTTSLTLQLHFLEVSESMGNHDSKIVDAGSID